MKKKVYIGFSGGVDSSVSAYLLKQQGFQVTGIYISNLYPESCAGQCSQEEITTAEKIAKYLDIPLEIWDFKDVFKESVIDKFIEKYSQGSTPNPCIECNKFFKFGLFAQKSFEQGADYISTGHYVQTKDGRLYKGIDPTKDQSYFLNRVSSIVLEKTIFPIGNMTKKEVRVLADEIGLPNSKKKDSQQICFLKNTTLDEFLSQNISTKSGDILDIDTNEKVGEHEGILKYTLGQRKGIKVGGVEEPYFVAKQDIEKNILYVANGRENKHLWKDTFQVDDFSFVHPKNSRKKFFLKAVIRYHSKEIPCRVSWKKSNGVLKGMFKLRKKVWTPSIGQSLVIYKGKECLGGGEITKIV